MERHEQGVTTTQPNDWSAAPGGTRMPAYSITEVEAVDAGGARRYEEIAKPAIEGHGGRFLVLGAEPTVPEGDWPPQQRVVIIEWPSMEQMRAWYDSPEYAPARDVARSALHRRLLFVDGV